MNECVNTGGSKGGTTTSWLAPWLKEPSRAARMKGRFLLDVLYIFVPESTSVCVCVCALVYIVQCYEPFGTIQYHHNPDQNNEFTEWINVLSALSPQVSNVKVHLLLWTINSRLRALSENSTSRENFLETNNGELIHIDYRTILKASSLRKRSQSKFQEKFRNINLDRIAFFTWSKREKDV